MNYINNLQNQSSALPSNFIRSNITPTAIFSSAIQVLQNELFSNIMTSLNMDKNRKENILLVSVCKLIDKIATHDTLLNNFIDKEEKSQDNMMDYFEKRLNNMEQLLQQKISYKQDAIAFDKCMHTMENKLKNQLQSIQHSISDIYNKLDNKLDNKVDNKFKVLQHHLSIAENKYNKLDNKLTVIQNNLTHITQQSINNGNESMVTHCNGTSLQNILSKDSLEKEQNSSNQTHEYLNQILTILNNKQTRELNAMESRLCNIETQLKSHTNLSENIYNEMRNFNAHNNEMNVNKTDPTQYEKLLHKIHQMDKKINIIKNKQIELSECGEKQIEIIKHLKTEYNQIEEALLSQSISMQSMKSKAHSTTEALTSIGSQLKPLANTHDIESINQSLKSLQSQLLSFTNNKYNIPLEHQPLDTITSTKTLDLSAPSTNANDTMRYALSKSTETSPTAPIESFMDKLKPPTNNNNNILSKNRIGGNISQISNHSVNNQSTSTSLQNPHDIIQNQTSHALQHKKKEIDTSFTDTLTPQTLSLKNNKNDASPQILSNNMTDIRNNYIPNKSTKIATPAAQPTNNTANTHTLSSVSSTTSIIPPSEPQQTASFTNVTDPQILSLKNNKHDTSSQKFSLANSTLQNAISTKTPQTFTTSSKVIKDAYFPTYNPTTPTLSFTSKQKLRYYHEEHYKFGLGTKQDICIMDFERCTNFYKYRIDRNVKSLARNPFSAVGIIPSQDAIEAAINYKELGNEWYSKREFGHAIEQYQLAQKLDPTNAVYKLNESAATLMLKDYKRTIRCCEDALLYANDVKLKWKAYKRMGVVEERRGNINKCIEYYKKAQDEKCDADLKKKIKTICSKNT